MFINKIYLNYLIIRKTYFNISHLLNFKKASIFNNNLSCGHSSVVERLVANEKVVGSSPIARSKIAKIFVNENFKLQG